jgi:RNA polymerase sigma-70 factor, ECF subfamily
MKTAAADQAFAELRPLLFSIAYRMVASVSTAEDLVQEAYLRYRRALEGGTVVESLKAYVSAIVTRLAIDELESARAQRETYVGEWLPEPLLTDDGHLDPHDVAERSESLSMAFLLVLEWLNPVERAVFLLHDVFGYEFSEVSQFVDKSEANCRQIARRARKSIEARRPRFPTPDGAGDRLADRFFAAITDGDVDGLVALLAADAAVYGDGGGKAPQWRAPINGVARVARLLGSVGRQIAALGGRIERRPVNGQPGALVCTADGRLVNVFVLDIVDGAVETVRSVINPDKLRHIGELADVRAILGGGTEGDADPEARRS